MQFISEIQKLKKQVRLLQKITIILSAILLFIMLASASLGSFTLIQATRFEVIDESGNVMQVLDKEGLKQTNNNHQNWNNNYDRHNSNDRIRFLFNRLGSSSGYIQISNLSGELLATQNYYCQFDEKIIINNTVTYFFDKNTQEIRLNNALVIGNAADINKAIDLCLFHYANSIFQP